MLYKGARVDDNFAYLSTSTSVLWCDRVLFSCKKSTIFIIGTLVVPVMCLLHALSMYAADIHHKYDHFGGMVGCLAIFAKMCVTPPYPPPSPSPSSPVRSMTFLQDVCLSIVSQIFQNFWTSSF